MAKIASHHKQDNMEKGRYNKWTQLDQHTLLMQEIMIVCNTKPKLNQNIQKYIYI